MTPNIIPSIFTGVDRVTRVTRQIGLSLRGLSMTSDASMARMQRSFAATSNAAMGIATSSAAIGAAILIPLGLATKAAVGFEAEMGNVATLVDTTRENMDEMGEGVMRVGRRIAKPLKDLTESLYQIRSAGIGAGDAMHVLEVSGELAVAGLSTATEATKSVTSAMVAFKTQGLSTEQIANSFFLTVKQGKTKMDAINESFGSTALIVANAGMSLQEFNAATAAMTNAGFTASEAQTALRGATIALIKPTGEMVDVLSQMGFTGTDAGNQLIKKMGGVVAAMQAIKDAAGHAGDNINKAFGRVQGLNALIALTGNQNAQFKSNLKEQLEGANALNEAFGKQSAQAAAKMQIFKTRVQELGINIGKILIPVLTKIVDIVGPVVDGISSFAKNHKILTGIVIDSVAALGVLAATASIVGFTVGTVTKGFWLLKGALYAYQFTAGFVAVKTGTLTGALIANKAAAQGATFGLWGFNTALKASLVSAMRLAAILVPIYATMKLFEKKHEAENRMNAILPHLPAGVDKEKFKDQFSDIFSPGHQGLLNQRPKPYPQSLFDSLGNKYFDEPMRRQDSMMNAPIFMPAIDTPSKPVGYVPKQASSSQNITITLENNTGHTASVTSQSGKSAAPVAIKIVSTSSRAKPQTA